MDHQRALLVNNREQPMNLLPGFRFHPTDEELISYYLLRKAMDASFSSIAIGDIDLVKFEPWDLPERANYAGQNEWYFFCMKDRKYPTGTRANRATGTGYWKSTGKDKVIHHEKSLIGMKKTLVFYTGRAPRGHKSDWVMHEYRLDGKYSSYSPYKNEWVVCRVVKKTECDHPKKSSTTPVVSDDNKLSPGASNIGAPHVNCFSSHETIFNKNNNCYLINNINNYNSDHLCSFQDPNINPYYESSSSLVLEGDGERDQRSMLEVDNFIRGKEIVTSSSLETGLTTEFNQEISSCLMMTPCGDHMDNCFM